MFTQEGAECSQRFPVLEQQRVLTVSEREREEGRKRRVPGLGPEGAAALATAGDS